MSAAKTKAKRARADSRPRQDFNAINQQGLKAQALAIQHQAQIGPRLSAAFLAAFATDIAGLVAIVPMALGSQTGSVQLTAAQSATLGKAYKLVKGLRTTVKGEHPSKEVLLAYGVGIRIDKHSVPEVSAAIQRILDRIAAEPGEASQLDIGAVDVQALTAALHAIQQADAAQEAARARAPQTTKERNATARRVLAGIHRIAGAGMRTFLDDPTIYANFEALVTKRKAA